MRNSDVTKKLIVSKALSIFNTKGYHATSLSDITNATGITKGAIYGNFKNKDEVATAAYDLAGETVLVQLGALMRAQPTAPTKLQAIVNYFENYIENPPIEGGCPIINTGVEADNNYPLLRSKVIRTIAQIKESIAKIVYRGIKEGQVKGNVDVEEFVAFFFATIQGGVLVSRIEGDNRSYSHVQKRMLIMISDISS